MHTLHPADLLGIWTRGADRHPIDRALILLAYAFPERDWEQLCRLPLGERNRLLLIARAASFGAALEIVSRCPSCTEPAEFTFTFPLADLPVLSPDPVDFTTGETTLRLRLPDSRDLAAVASLTPQAARRHLIQRCLISTTGETAPGDAAIQAVFSAAVEAHDTLAAIAFPLTCPSCDQRWRATLDPIDYVWRELTQRVTLVVREVHTLARTYGWTEREILSLPAAHRRLYLQQIGA